MLSDTDEAFVATFEQTEGVVEASRFLYSFVSWISVVSRDQCVEMSMLC
jgi:hypothetical protein